MSVSRFYPLDFDFFDGFPGTRGRHPLVPFEETHTSRMMQPKYVSVPPVPVFRIEYPVTNSCGTGWTCTKTKTRTP